MLLGCPSKAARSRDCTLSSKNQSIILVPGQDILLLSKARLRIPTKIIIVIVRKFSSKPDPASSAYISILEYSVERDLQHMLRSSLGLAF
jgi:hypothetical protein